ncbi:F-actin-monooxygenase Mical isoform X4 [Homalodisca vitripennis]|uniref:F-actin-monooxygenase Mical isoform X4 n=1 Tax=Homalodisca vitripennis TaxID=197043 RepID=UPI001EEA04F0|nr:F-actin-monooxygenase Mical isoform X4 [Homalodisca vitripennis]
MYCPVIGLSATAPLLLTSLHCRHLVSDRKPPAVFCLQVKKHRGTAMDHPRKAMVSPDSALAADVFDQFCSANTLKTILGHFRHLCDILHIKPTNFPHFYPKLKAKLRSWKAQALWNKFDKRAAHKCYNRGKACPNTRVLVIGGGPCGLRSAIEAQLLGAKVVVVEKRDRMSRNNVLHLWPFVIQDLRALGAKKFFGKFCAGSIDHISIRQLQCILLKVALIFGVEFHEGVGFESLLEPPEDQSERIGWRALTSPPDHPVSQYEFDVLIGADGRRNTLEGFKRKEFRGKLAIAITANFINRKTEAEARVEEISGVAFIFNQKFFKDLYEKTGIDLENIVYYKDETHYFVMTAKKHSLIDKGVILQDWGDTARLLSPDNVDKDALEQYAKEAADFSTNYNLPALEFAVNHYGQSDVAMFDFTSMYAAENASRVVDKRGHRLLMTLVGDSLLEPFWPTGSGCARGFLSSLDACWAVRGWGMGHNPLEVLAERESIYRILGQTTPENLQRDLASYTLDPVSRYPNLNSRCVLPVQVRGLYLSDSPGGVEALLAAPTLAQPEQPKKRRKRDTQVHPDTLLLWLKKQVALYDTVQILDMSTSFKDGLALCAIIHRYRPDLIDFHSLQPQDVAANNQLAFDILERELGIPPVMTGQEMEDCVVPDTLTMLSYLSQIYDTFRGEIPHIKHPKLEESDLVKEHDQNMVAMWNMKLRNLSTTQRLSLLGRMPSPRERKHVRHSVTTPRTDTMQRRARKRRSDKASPQMYRRARPPPLNIKPVNEDIPGGCLQHRARQASKGLDRESDQLRMERIMRRQYLRHKENEQFQKSMQMLSGNAKSDDKQPFEDYSIFVYRQTAPDFHDRIKELELKILYPDKDQRLLAEVKKSAMDPHFSGRVKNIEDKLRGIAHEKKPKDLHRAIGKIEKSDWNVKEIEKKITENKFGRGTRAHTEKVPKWSKEQYDDKVRKIQMRDTENGSKFTELDDTLKRIERKMKEGGVLEQGKVSALAAHLTNMNQEPEKPPLQKSNSKAAFVMPSQGASETCHFCNKRVYLMERLSAEGKFFHRGCFRCDYCNNILRLGNYAFDRDGRFGSRFFCIPHFGLTRVIKREEVGNKENIPSQPVPKTPVMLRGEEDMMDQGTTPERIEFENLSGVGETASDQEDSEMDEDEWTDRNFGASAAEASSDEASDLSDSEDEEEFAEALDVNVGMTADETLRLAEHWTRRYNRQKEADEEESGSCHDSDDSREHFSYQEYDSEAVDDEFDAIWHDCSPSPSTQVFGATQSGLKHEESETATEGEEEVRARELRRQEARVEAPDIDTGSDTEVASDDYTTSSGSEESESEAVENSATEISTDSEFEHDGTTPTQQNIPDIVISESVHVKRGRLEEPRKVQVLTKPINGKLPESKTDVQLEFSPLVPDRPSLNNINNNSGPSPLVNPRRGDYLLNRTHSTEGIASKISLELKKRYLLGPSGLSGSVKKSGSASTLDSRFKSFVDQISEHQKLLNPAPEPSPTMQAFLQGADKIHNSPSITHIVRREKELPGVSTFSHICQLKDKETVVPSNKERPSIVIDKPNSVEAEHINNVIKMESKEEHLLVGDEEESRARSPVHETSIVVPDLPQNKKEEEEDIDSDSLSSDNDSSLEEESDHKSQGQVNIPPKVEIHNSRGELMEDESGGVEVKPDIAEVGEGSEEPPPLDSLNMVVPDICQHTRPTDFLPNILLTNRTNVDLVPAKDKESGTFQKIITVPSTSEKVSERGQVLKQVPTTAELFVSDEKTTDGSKGSGKSSPSSPLSNRDDDESFRNESLTAALTETELSDWARDEDVGVSENLEDLEFNINPQYITFRRHHKPKNKRNSRGVAAKIARTEDFDDEFSHVCGKVDKVPQTSNLLVNTDNIEYMDTGGEEESSHEEYLRNSGYVQFINPTDEDEDIITPTADTPINCLPGDLKDSAEDGGDTTTSNSEAVTIMESPLDAQKDFEPNLNSPVIETTPTPDLNNKTYEEYVKRLQGRISPFSNVRDSIDIRKSRKHSSGKISNPTFTTEKTLIEDKEENTPNIINKPVTMSQKLEELSKERSKQKDLIHEMVLEKLMVRGKSPQERKAKRNARNTPSPRLGSQNSIISIPSDKTEPSQETGNIGSKISMTSQQTPTSTIDETPREADRPEQNHNEVAESSEVTPEVFDTPNVNISDLYFTPMTSFKEQAAKSRPLSMNFSFRLQNSTNKNKTLPFTPLTNPEAFSLPDIRKALFDSENSLNTPVPPPRLKALDREQVRETARARAKMLTDEELGLSPEERIQRLKEKVSRRFERSESSPASSHVETPSLDNNIQISLSRSNESLTVVSSRVQQHPTSLPDTKSKISPTIQTNEISPSSSHKPDLRLEITSPEKKSKSRDGKKSIIQVVSSIFHKKSPTSLSPPKSAPATSGHTSKFSKFKLHKNKDKAKSANSSDVEDAEDKKSPIALSKSMSETEARRRLIDESVAPPVPPPPLNYPSSRQHSEDSMSELEGEDSHASIATNSASSRKRTRMARKMERQAHLKRLRMAQEIQRQLEELEVKQRELETRGVDVEKAIRAENASSGGENSVLLKEWFELMRERSELRRYERELLVRRQEMELEDRHARLQHELRQSLAKDDKTKTNEEVASEGRILREMLEIVERRDSLINQLEEDRQSGINGLFYPACDPSCHLCTVVLA